MGPAAVTPALLDEAAVAYHDIPAGLTQQEINDALDPRRFIAERTLQGGPAPEESLRQSRLFEDGLAADEQVIAGIDARLEAAWAKLETAIDAIVS